MANIFASNQHLTSLPPLVGMEILQYLKTRSLEKISLLKLLESMNSRQWFSPTTVCYALMFLYVTGLIDFDGVHIWVSKNATN